MDTDEGGSGDPVKHSILILVIACFLVVTVSSAKAQQGGKIPVIGYLSITSGPGLGDEAFRQALTDLGYVEGKNIAIVYRWAGGKSERLPELAADLVRLKVDVIVTGAGGYVVALAAKNATKTIPIVMAIIGGDPVGSGLVASLARPGGNVTGFSNVSPELAFRRLELVKETFPNAARVAFFWAPSTTGDPSDRGKGRLEETKLAAKELRLDILPFEVERSKDLATAFGTAAKQRAGAVMIPSYIVSRYQAQILDLSVKTRLGASCDSAGDVERWGCLMAYGPNLLVMFRRAATYVDKILKGTKPTDLPVERPMKFDFVISLKAAKEIGLTIPPNVLVRATRVIK